MPELGLTAEKHIINNEEGSNPQNVNIIAKVGSPVGMKHDIKTENKRVPRYFDPPEWFFPESDDGDLNNYNSERCKVQRKRRTCYICGDNGHDGNRCKQVDNFENEDLANNSQITEYNDKVDATDVHESREASSSEEEVPEESSKDLMEEDKIQEYNDDINNEEGSYPQKVNIVAEVGSPVGMKHDIKTENKVVQKLTRVPRYFDPPEWFFPESDDGDLNNYNSERCKVQRKRRTCYICGDNGHDGNRCKQVNACFICSEKGHLITNCPNKNLDVDCASRLCLMCGDMGHDMLSCTNGYDSEDLKNIQCYICKEFGHLCCVDSNTEEVREVSCYRCGESGHLGFECVKLEGVTNDSESVQLCAECRERGHSLKEYIKCLEANTWKTAMEQDTAKRSKSEKRRARKARKAARNRAWLDDNASQSQPNWAHGGWRPQIVGPYYGKPRSNVWFSPAARSNSNHLASVQGLPPQNVTSRVSSWTF